MTTYADPSTELLLKHLRESNPASGRQLWCADENQGSALPMLSQFNRTLTLLSNRYDVAETAENAGVTSIFSDWIVPEEVSFTHVYLRICKEKPVNLHLLQLAYDHLQTGGQIILAGQKDEGIKTIAKYAEGLFNKSSTLKKHGLAYIVDLTKDGKTDSFTTELEQNDYHQIRFIGAWRNLDLVSKYGVYGWDKVDRGSELLVDAVLNYAHQNSSVTDSILDLGCGYGFLSVAVGSLLCKRRVATDNNAAAIMCTQTNARAHKLTVEVVAGNCGNTLPGQFDLVLCNPPFHKGFNVETDLTRRFVVAAAQKTHRHGIAFFVVNSFIPIEQKIQGAFRTQRILANDGQFKVVALTH